MTKDEKEYHILVIEDNFGDFIIVEEHLKEEILKPVIIHASNYKEAVNILQAGLVFFDIILLDLSLPDKSGQQLVESILEFKSLCPVIILTGYTDLDFSIQSVGRGVSDYLLKDKLNASVIYKSIIYAIERKKRISELESSQKQYSDLFNLSPQPKWLLDSETSRFIKVNQAAIALYGYSEAEFLNMSLMDLKRPEGQNKPFK